MTHNFEDLKAVVNGTGIPPYLMLNNTKSLARFGTIRSIQIEASEKTFSYRVTP